MRQCHRILTASNKIFVVLGVMKCPFIIVPGQLVTYFNTPEQDSQGSILRVSSVVEHSSANPKVPVSIPGLVSYWGHQVGDITIFTLQCMILRRRRTNLH